MNEKRGGSTVNICGTNIAQNIYRKRPNKVRNRVMSHSPPIPCASVNLNSVPRHVDLESSMRYAGSEAGVRR